MSAQHTNARNGYDALLFDLDGTLADTTEDLRAALAAAFADLGVDVGPRLASLVDGSPLEELFAVVVADGTPAQLLRFIERYRYRYEASMLERTTLYPGVRETLEVLAALRPRPLLAVATAKREGSARALLEGLGVAGHFDLIAGSGASNIPHKPAPDLLLKVARELRVEPSRSMMIGDTSRDVLAGKRAGMRTAAVTYGLGGHAALAPLQPDYLLEEFDELLVLLGATA